MAKDRQKIITALIDTKGLGLEVGPCHSPVAPKSEGYNVRIVDHLATEDLRRKYAGHGLDVERIEEVDYVWNGEPLEDLLAADAEYDWIVASHVIEHVPDPVSFIHSCQKVLKPGGILSLAIPDKRYCFDYLRPPSTTGGVLQAFLEKRTRHTPGQIFDSFSLAAVNGGTLAWQKGADGEVDFLHAHGLAGLMLQDYLASDGYVDIHGWVFTPSSFRLIIHDLNALGYLDIREESFTPTVGCEFFVSFRNAPAPDPAGRIGLARAALQETTPPRRSWFGR
ncbi:methyltransferase domain-containing protein [Luteimonas vadosa]|uniref:Class I SAM-dependent methyltransferase n=1 Tax=Luteimonas vadosa TaxID=1165507 RepID=A0ABP9DNA2_9GAMM